MNEEKDIEHAKFVGKEIEKQIQEEIQLNIEPSDGFEAIEKFIPPRNVKCSDCMANPIPELIDAFLDSYERLRDFVLEAPILSEDIYKLRQYLDSIKEEIIKEIKKWKKGRES